MMRYRPSLSWLALFLALLLGFPIPSSEVFGQPPGPSGPPAMPVEAVAAKTGTISTDITAVGSLRASESVVIRPEITGRIAAIHFDEGQAIQQGAELITLDPDEYRAQLAESMAAVRLDRLNFERSRELLKKKLISQQQYDEAVAKLAASQAKQNLDQARLSKTELRAPFSGILGLRQVSPGDYVQPGQNIVNLEAIDPLKADFRVPETYAAHVHAGSKVQFSVDAFPDRTFEGTVYAISPRIDETTRTLLLRARVPNPKGELRPGMFARVRLELERRDNAVLVPEEALVPMGDDLFVYRIVDGKAVMTKVAIGQRRDAMVEITHGVRAGELVVTAGQMKIGDGAPVMLVGAPGGPPQEPLARGD